MESFKDVYGKYTFDPVLLFVAFRKINLLDFNPAAKEFSDWGISHLARSADFPPSGRFDMVFFFRWLRHKHNVTNITKVIVDEKVDDMVLARLTRQGSQRRSYRDGPEGHRRGNPGLAKAGSVSNGYTESLRGVEPARDTPPVGRQ